MQNAPCFVAILIPSEENKFLIEAMVIKSLLPWKVSYQYYPIF